MQNKMLTKKYFLEMVSASIKGSPIPSCPENISGELIYKLSVRNAVQGVLYLAVKSGAITLSAETEAKLQKSYMAILAREATQQEEIDYIREAFEKENIEFMFLKGIHLKSLYPTSQMRFMVDMDILVKEESMDKGGQLILARGFTQEMNNGKDIVLVKKPFLTIELHKMLFVEDYFMHDYFTSVWDRIEKVSDYEYKMPINDLYVYTLAHLAEHYLEAGSCFRPLMDLFLMEQKYADLLNFDYINQQFEEIGIDKFAKKIRQLYKCAFDGAEYNDDLITMENYIVFGAPVKNADEVAKVARTNKSKSKRFIESAFPNLKHMKLKYPILEKAPFLLPIFWVVRFFEFVFLKKGSLEQKQSTITNVDRESADIMKEIFEKSGF
ncbi:MAG: nucleotidyltransferase family protein [Clostridia bacterium]|nr:nucleotidyltransferase family protein [Clostridia bacterium]